MSNYVDAHSILDDEIALACCKTAVPSPSASSCGFTLMNIMTVPTSSEINLITSDDGDYDDGDVMALGAADGTAAGEEEVEDEEEPFQPRVSAQSVIIWS